MSAPGFPDACAPLVKALADADHVFQMLHDTLLEINSACAEPDAVRMRVGEGIEQVEQGMRILALEGSAE